MALASLVECNVVVAGPADCLVVLGAAVLADTRAVAAEEEVGTRAGLQVPAVAGMAGTVAGHGQRNTMPVIAKALL